MEAYDLLSCSPSTQVMKNSHEVEGKNNPPTPPFTSLQLNNIDKIILWQYFQTVFFTCSNTDAIEEDVGLKSSSDTFTV